MGTSLPKQYLPLLNETVIAITVKRLANFPGIKGIFVGISPDDTHWPTIKYQIGSLLAPLETYTGGESRAQTVLNGLKLLSEKSGEGDWVLVHDAARPCIRNDDIQKLIDETGNTVGGSILALPIGDTVKQTDDKDQINQTVSREHLWRALTPQYFPVSDLKSALTKALDEGVEITDEASAMEFAGAHPKCIVGRADNIKITFPDDLELAEMYLRNQQKELRQ